MKIYKCPTCNTNDVVRQKPRGRLPICADCKLKAKAKLLSDQRAKRKAGIWDAHHNRRTQGRYDRKKPWPPTCALCGQTYTELRQGQQIDVCPQCRPQAEAERQVKLNARKRRYYATDAHGAKHAGLRAVLRKFGLTMAWYDALDKRCYICGSTLAGGRGRMHFDHNHDCCAKGCPRCFRGLLCHKCNIGLGHFHDDPSLLASAIKYLAEHPPKQ